MADRSHVLSVTRLSRDDKRMPGRSSTARLPEPQRSTTQQTLHELNLAVPDERFNRAMAMAARDMGGAYDQARGVIRLPPSMARPGDPSFPQEIEVHYRKFPCGMVMRNIDEHTPGVGEPCVSFDVIPRVPGDPRRSRVYQSFQGPASQAKTLFGKFLGWLKIVSKAMHRYKAPSAHPLEFARIACKDLPPSSVERVAATWLLSRGRR